MRARLVLSDQSGATAVEFAMIAPVFLTMMMGMLDIGHNMYTAQVLHGSIQQAARGSTIEGAGGRVMTIDDRVKEAVGIVSPDAEITISRTAYANFSDVGRPEDYTDTDSSGSCDAGEPFEDVNGNGSWDADRGQAGLGGARDAVLYRVEVSYPRLFPIAGFIGLDDHHGMVATTVLRNQPYGLQNTSPVEVRTCD